MRAGAEIGPAKFSFSGIVAVIFTFGILALFFDFFGDTFRFINMQYIGGDMVLILVALVVVVVLATLSKVNRQ